MIFILTVGFLTVCVALASRRRGMFPREVAAVAGGFVLAMIALGVVGADDGAMVGLAALGGGIVQWGIDAHRQRQHRHTAAN